MFTLEKQGSRRIARLKGRRQVETQVRAEATIRAVGYLRVSTEDQARDGHGLDAQERAVRAFAESQRYELVDVATDPGISGATRPADRPGFRRVLELAQAAAFTVLLVPKFDRLGRDIRHAVTCVSDLAESHGVVIRSVSEPIDTATPMGRMLFAILAGMAEQERFTIRDRTASGRREKARKGGLAGGRAPYGYRLTEAGLMVVPEQARIVRRIHAARTAKPKRTLQAIADQFNAEGIPGPGGTVWRPSGVAYLADNPKYRGFVEYLFTWDGSETHVLEPGSHLPIIQEKP